MPGGVRAREGQDNKVVDKEHCSVRAGAWCFCLLRPASRALPGVDAIPPFVVGVAAGGAMAPWDDL
eukprot:2430832-Pyramimonas_sp.AAC.1